MKRAIALLIALSFWALPLAAASQTEATPKLNTEIKTEQVTKQINVQSPQQTILQSPAPAKLPKVQQRVQSGRHYSKEEVQALIIKYSEQYGVSADLPLRVANCESGYNQLSKNRSSTASGVFQYIHSTWIHTELGKQGLSVFDADANVHMAVKSIASGGISNWAASRSCWSK